MTTHGVRTRTEQAAATGNTYSGRAPQLPCQNDDDDRLARRLRPVLYWQIAQEDASLEHIVRAWRIRSDPANKDVGEEGERVSRFLECLARDRLSNKHQGIKKHYFSDEPWAGCILTGDGWVDSVMNDTDPELVFYEHCVHQLCRDARRAFEAAPKPSKKAREDLVEVGELLYGVLTRVIYTASVLKDKRLSQRERDDALPALRVVWRSVRASVEEMIQRQARFEYFEGVGLGALITIAVVAAAGVAAAHLKANQLLSEPGEPGSLMAALIGGTVGAVISVTQRITGRGSALVLDFTASKRQKSALGALRPLVGAVFGAVVYFTIVGGFLAVDRRTTKDASIALAFFAVAGFAAGFSERWATDVLESATSGILPTTRDQQGVQKPDGTFGSGSNPWDGDPGWDPRRTFDAVPAGEDVPMEKRRAWAAGIRRRLGKGTALR